MVITVEPASTSRKKSWRSNRRRCPDHESGYKFLSERLTRDPDEIEKIMAAAAKQRAKNPRRATIDRLH